MNAISPLSTNEMALLQIMAQGGSVADLGEHSRWSEPLQSLERRGFVRQAPDKFNYVITPAGLHVLHSSEDDEASALIELNNAIAAARQNEMEVLSILKGACTTINETIGGHLPRERRREAWAVVRGLLDGIS